MAIRLHLLGRPQVRSDDVWRDVASEKRFLLLAFLACQEGWVERDRLAFLFWPDVDEARARGNLRQLLRRARGYPFAAGMTSAGGAVRWDVASDVTAFRQALGSGAWADAVELYRGDLLDGSVVDDGSGLAEWLELERETLQRQWREACLERAEQLRHAGGHAEAGRLLHRVLHQDVLAEDAVQAFLRSALASGQRELGLRLYGTFQDRLWAELALEPLAATKALAEALRAGGAPADAIDGGAAAATGAGDAPAAPFSPDASARPAPSSALAGQVAAHASTTVASPPGRTSTLPAPASPLIGRDLELAELAGVLADPDRRLVTFVGPGGTGKSRLALEAAWERVGAFEHGCHLVPLAPLDDPELIPAAIADRLAIPRAGQGDAAQHVLAYLRDKRMLVVLDNLEHLLDGAGFVAEMLDAAPGLRLLVTSREALGFDHEARFELAGLGYPDDVEHAGQGWLDTYDAVRLFVQRARRQVPSFAVRDLDKAPLLELCRLLQGNPLGLELAAVWVRSLQVRDIVEALRDDIDALAASAADVPERHRSLRAVFDHSWALLADEERRAMAAFSVFRGGATKSAALEVTGASLRTLLMLVNKSLLTRSPAGRFEVLEPLRQYAHAVLHAHHDASAEAQQRHARAFSAFVATCAPGLRAGSEQRQAFARIDDDLDNVRAAWGFVCRARSAEPVTLMLDGVGLYLERRNAFQEGVAMLEQARRAFAAPPALNARLCVWAAVFHGSTGAYDEAERLLEGVLEGVLEEDASLAPDAALVSTTLLRWAIVRRQRGDYALAKEKAREALAGFDEAGDAWSAAHAHNLLGGIAVVEGDLKAALDHFGACAATRRAISDTWGSSVPLLNLGTVHRYLGAIDEAERHYLESLALAREHGNLVGVSFVLGTLAAIDLSRGALVRAEARYLESLAIRRSLGDRWLVANSLVNLAPVYGRRGAFERAEAVLEEARSLFADLGDAQGLATGHGAEAALLLAQGRHRASARAYRRALEQERALGHAYGAMSAQEGLARVALAMGDVAAARTGALEVLGRAHAGGFTQLVLGALMTVAECAAADGDSDEAVRISRVVVRHAAADDALSLRAASIRERAAGAAPAADDGAHPSLEDAVIAVLGAAAG